MTLDEGEVWSVFVHHLIERGWDITADPADSLHGRTSESSSDFGGILARRGAEVLIAGFIRQSGPVGAAVDSAYGNLLGRMVPELHDATFALVAPEALLWHVERVSADVRRRCRIEVYLINDLAGIRKL